MTLSLRIAAGLVFLLLITAPLDAAQRPNLLFIMTDDQAPFALGASGNPQALTPNLDRLAREGAYLKNSFTVTPVCSPSRVSLMTSRYGSEMGITDWIHPSEAIGVDPRATTFAEVLSAAGYQTGLVGKWHLGHADEKWHPTRNGYHYFMGFLEGGTKAAGAVLEKDGKPQKFEGLTADVLTDHALQFLEGHKQGPFFLSLHYRAPHRPWLPVAEEDAAPYRDLDIKIPNPDYPGLLTEKVKRVTREYLSSVRSVDRNVGRILQRLEAQGLDKNTVVIFTSDHGYNLGHGGIWHKGNGHWIVKDPPPGTENVPRGQRPNMYDRSLRVPTLVRWPGKIHPGTVVEQTVSNLDWYPTLVSLAGGELPQDETIRGRSIVPLLTDEATPEWNNDLYAEYSTKHQTRTHMRCYRTPDWKLVRDFLNPGRDELYDLKNDPEETTNLIKDSRPEVQQVVQSLHAKILEQMRRTGDPVLETLSESTSASR